MAPALSSSRRRDFDLLRVGSMIAVVFLHTAAAPLQAVEFSPAWILAELLAALGSAAVPLFFMLSGALLLSPSRESDVGSSLLRRVARVALPGLVWSLLAVLLLFLQDGDGGKALLRLVNLPGMAALTPYWFLYALLPLYLLSPLLKIMADHLEERHWRYLLLLWLLLSAVRRTVYAFLPPPWNSLFAGNPTLGVDFLEGYLGYFLLGAWLDRQPRLPSRTLLMGWAAGSWALIALGGGWDCLRSGVYEERFFSYQGLFAVSLSVSLFLLVKSLWGGRESGRALGFFAKCSFGVYLCHPMVLAALRLLWPEAAGVGGLLSTWLLTLLGSVALTVLLGSLKPLCYLFTGQTYRQGPGLGPLLRR